MQNKRENNLFKYSTTTPWEFIIVTVMYVIGAVSIPPNLLCYIFGDSLIVEFISLFLVRALSCIMPIWLLFSIRLQSVLGVKNFFKGLLVIVPFLVVATNNFPIVSIITGEAKLNADITTIEWIGYAFAILGGVVLEELCFRGIIFPTLLRKYKDKKNKNFLCVVYSSLIFGGVHIVNLFAGAGAGVIMQIGYSFLIGAMCAITFLKTGNFHHAVLLHFIYNVGGLLYQYDLVLGNVWGVAEIVVTALLAVITIVYAVIILFKYKNDNLIHKI